MRPGAGLEIQVGKEMKVGRIMQTQSMLDTLTDHLAIYYRSSSSTSDAQAESSKARDAVVQWLVGLSCEQRRAALTFVDKSWVAILLLMQEHLRTEGLCTFFLLPDVLPVTDRDRPKAPSIVGNTTKAARKSSSGRGISKGRKKGGTEDPPSGDGKRMANKGFATSSPALPLPELCFRRARGFILRSETEIQQTSGNPLVYSIRLFSSGDGENNHEGDRLCSSSFGNNSCTLLDCVTVTEDFIADIGTFLKVMDHLSHDQFLNTSPFLSAAAASTWEETPWLKSMGYYSMPAFIANRFEFELWAAWNRAQGTKKPPRSLSVKSTKGGTHNGSIAAGNSLGNGGAIAASAFGRKQGCMDWWRKLERKDRAGLVNCTLAHTTKVEVLKIVRETRAGRGKTYARVRSKDSGGNTKLEIGNSRSVSDSEVEQYLKPGTDDRQGAEITSYFAGLRALRELSEYGWLPCGNSQITESIEEDDDTSLLFGSTLESVHTFLDQIKRKVRNTVVKVKNDCIELELLGDGSISSNKAHGGKSEGKISKTKKKKRKNITTPKAEVHMEEDQIISSFKPELPQEERTQQLGQRPSDSGDVELPQARSCNADEAWNEVKSLSGGKQHGSRKGKGRKSKGNKDDKLHQLSGGSKKSAVNAAENLGRHSMDLTRYSHGSLENGNGPCSECDGPVTSGDRFDRIPSLKIQEESPVKFVRHGSSVTRCSSCSIVDLGQIEPEKLQSTLIPSLDSTSVKISLSNRENDEVLPDIMGSMAEAVTCHCANYTDICPVGSTLCTNPPIFREVSIKTEVCPISPSGTSDSKNDLFDDRSCGQTLSEASFPIVENGKFLFEEKQNSLPDSQKTTSTSGSPTIRFGTLDAAVLPDSNETISVPAVSLLCNNEERLLENSSSSNAKPVPSARNGRLRLPLSSRQLDYSSSSSRHSHYQQNPLFRSPHEWPGSPQFGYFGAYHQPKATDWLQLDVGRGWPHRMEPSLLSYSRNIAPVLRPQSGLAAAESLMPITVATRNGNGMGNLDRPPLLQPSYNITPPVGYTIAASKEEPRHNGRSFFNPSPFSSGYGDLEDYGQGRSTDDSEKETKLFAYDTDVDDYGMYKSSGEFDDLDGYMISEEEVERYVEDVASAENSSSDYHQIFGGGVMYWNASDYAGLGYSRPGSLSSEDSSWARHEADLSAVLDDIVNYQPHQNSYSNVPSCSPSPPSSSSVPKSFERLSPVASSNARTFLPRPTTAKPEFNSGKFGQPPSFGLSLDDQLVGARVPITVELIEQIRADSSAQPILRPIVVVRERQVPSGEVRRLQEAKSPHIVPRSRRDLPGHRKRPPSPVLRCVPPAPPPPPPSPVSGPRRRKGLMGARSGSSSPRHWGLVNWPYKDESDSLEGNLKGDNQEGFPILGGRKRGSTTSTPPMYPLSGALLRERLVAIPPLSLEQEHPDVSIPMKTTILHNSNPALHLALTKLLSALHVEIEAFSVLVEAENKMRKPFINMAVKKVAHSLQVLWPRSRINIFGSIATGLALPTSDVDLVVCLPPVRNLEPIKEAGILEGRNGIKETSLQHAARYLADQDWVKNDTMKTIENTPVPIIMMVAEFLPHQCEVGDEDTSLSSSQSIGKEACEEATKTENGVAVPLVESVTCREHINLATEEKKGPWGGKAARQLVHLDISFETPSHTGLRTAELVRELVGQYPALSPLALVLKQFLTDRSLDHPYSGGLSSYCLVLLITRFLQHQHHHGKPSSNQNLGKLFMDFLHFFGCDFDPLKVGIRIRGGGMYLSRDRYNDIDPLYIEDPLHPDNNVGRNCFRILQCVKAFADGYAILERKLHDMSIGSDDVNEEAEGLQLLQMILPCIMTK